MDFAYADPPYIGQARKHYGHAEVDHRELVETLNQAAPDGWALSCSSPTLSIIIPMCPSNVRIMAWVKPFCAFKKNVTVAYAWEPVIVYGGRKRPTSLPTVRDWVSACITLKKGCSGAKPPLFCNWLLDVLYVQEGDTLWDVYPGTGIVSEIARTRGVISFS